jgi:serine/threonine protein kinase
MESDNYIIEREIGQGGMATVYLARHKHFDRQVAMKVLKKGFLDDENIRARFLFEAKTLANLNHPNVIKVTDIIDSKKDVSFVMEYIEGVTLKDYINQNGSLLKNDLKTIFSQILEAVNYIHSKGYVHRDIKPSNFIVGNTGNVILLDFGIMKNLGISSIDLITTGTMDQMGSPIYMSPEQIKSFKETDERSDLYSLGVLLWQLVTGRMPYNVKNESIYEVQTKVINERLETTGTTYDNLISKATTKELELRYSSIKELITDFESISVDSVNSLSIPDQNHESITVVVNEDNLKKDQYDEAKRKLILPTHKQSSKNGINLFLIPLIIFLISIIGFLAYHSLFAKQSNQQVVFDYEGLLDDSEEIFLSEVIYNTYSSTLMQMAIITQHDSVISRFGGIEEYARYMGNTLGVGHSTVNNGIVYVVSQSKKNVFIALGLGIHSIYSDEEVKKVIDETLVPNIISSKLAYGLEASIKRMKDELTPRLNKINIKQ